VFPARLTPTERVLDLGCGAGLDTILAARQVGRGGQVIGVDGAPGMVATARRAVAATGLENVSILQSNAEALPLPDGSVDAVLVNGLFNLVLDKAAIVREVARVLRPGGRLVGAEIVITDDRPAQAYDPESWFR
jgi:ubiquinone/menaquinone biosynthesis C-methylase UbiE